MLFDSEGRPPPGALHRPRGPAFIAFLCASELAVPDSLACICNARGSATGCPVITTVSVAQAKQLWYVDELADDRKWSVPGGSSRPAHTSAPAGSLAAILQAVGGSAGAQLATSTSLAKAWPTPAFVFERVFALRGARVAACV
jgi:hypothetical protein